MTGEVAREVRVSIAGLEHSADIAVMHAQLFDKSWARDDIARLLELPSCLALVAHPGSTSGAIGFLLAQKTPEEAEILSLGIARSWQRRGVGTLLVQRLIEMTMQSGAKRIFLDVGADNPAALALYGKLGFAHLARRKSYYSRPAGQREDALLMVRNL
jgi:ribosomal-protein-alanine N-acetyltransferase